MKNENGELELSEEQYQSLYSSIQGTMDMNGAEASWFDYHFPGMDYGREDLTSELEARLDQDLFVCTNCGWNCEDSERNEHPEGDGDVCDDCLQELSPEADDD